MNEPFYSDAAVRVREDLDAAHAWSWARVTRPGTWWTGPERAAIAAEARHAAACGLCASWSDAPGPDRLGQGHQHLGGLSEPAIDVIHRVMNAPGHLRRAWFDSVVATGLSVEAYVEIIGVLATVVAVDTTARGVDAPQPALAAGEPGEPSRHRPDGLGDFGAWVPMLDPAHLADSERDLFPSGQAANIQRALSLVPEEIRTLQRLHAAQYVPYDKVADAAAGTAALTRPQVELVAGRVSAVNGCYY